MSDNLHAASSQWASRPADERFWSLRDMRIACGVARANSIGAVVPFAQLRVAPQGEDLALIGPTGQPARFTHYSFDRFAGDVGAPASYLRKLPVDIAAGALNASIAQSEEKSDRDLLFHKNGGLAVRACLSCRYDRVWDEDVCSMLERLDGWRPPAGYWVDGPSRIATAEDILPGQIRIQPGDKIGPSGLYASDHDMFAFLVAPDRVISDGGGGSLMRGFFVRNSEVGDSSLSVTFFLMQAVCGNHIVWNATGVHEIKVRHVGKDTLGRAFRGFAAQLRTYHDAAASEEGRILAARNMVLGNSKTEVLDALYKYAQGHSLPLSRARLGEALDVAAEHEDWYGNPRTVWAAVAGLTHASQKTGFADERANMDRAAGKLMQMAF
jgi:hypothetical protein